MLTKTFFFLTAEVEIIENLVTGKSRTSKMRNEQLILLSHSSPPNLKQFIHHSDSNQTFSLAVCLHAGSGRSDEVLSAPL